MVSPICSYSLHSPLEERWMVAPGIWHAHSYGSCMLYSLEAAPCRSHPKPVGWPEGSQLWQAGPGSAWLWFHRHAAVGNTYTIPSLPEQRVLATVLKADKADSRTIVGKGVGDLWGERNKTVVGKCQTTTNLLLSAQGLQPHLPQPYLPAWVTVGKELLGMLCPSSIQRPLNFSHIFQNPTYL